MAVRRRKGHRSIWHAGKMAGRQTLENHQRRDCFFLLMEYRGLSLVCMHVPGLVSLSHAAAMCLRLWLHASKLAPFPVLRMAFFPSLARKVVYARPKNRAREEGTKINRNAMAVSRLCGVVMATRWAGFRGRGTGRESQAPGTSGAEAEQGRKEASHPTPTLTPLIRFGSMEGFRGASLNGAKDPRVDLGARNGRAIKYLRSGQSVRVYGCSFWRGPGCKGFFPMLVGNRA